jgi:hypothetical protein
MDRLPQVLQNEIWEYIRGDRKFWKDRFKVVVAELDVHHAYWIKCQVDHFDHIKRIHGQQQTVLSPIAISKKRLIREGWKWMKEFPGEYKQALEFAQNRDPENPTRTLFTWANFVFKNGVYDFVDGHDGIFRPKFHPPSMERFSWAPLIPSHFKPSQNAAPVVRPPKRKAEIPMTQLEIASFFKKVKSATHNF